MIPDDPDGGSTASTAVVHLVAMAAAPAPDFAVADLRRELRTVFPVSGDVFAGPPSAGIVYLIVIPPGAGVDQLAEIVRWSALAEPRPGLVAAVAGGDARAAEAALAAGFDDAVVSGASVRELAARLRAVHRRVHWKGTTRPGRIRFGPLMLDLDNHELWVDGVAVPLTLTELAVLRVLMRARGRTLSRSDILDTAWGDAEDELEVSERAVDNVILRLRRKLPRPDVIQTVRGVGFRVSE
jgi:DNA-binding response OmpR family regulator